MTIRPDGKVVYVTSEGDGAVFAIDTQTNKVLQAHPGRPAAAVGRVPARRLARLRVARERGRDRGLRREAAEVPAAASSSKARATRRSRGRWGSPSHPDGSTVYVTAGSFGHLFFIDPVKNAPTGSFEVGQRPWGMALLPGGKIGLHRERPVERRLGDRSGDEAGREEDHGRQPAVGVAYRTVGIAHVRRRRERA